MPAKHNLGLQLGVMNSLGRLSGDNPFLSILLCAVVPTLFTHVPTWFRAVMELLVKMPFFNWRYKQYVYRRIVFHESDNTTAQPNMCAFSADQAEATSTERNNILQKAIRLYINKDTRKLSIKDAEIYLLNADTCAAEEKKNRMNSAFGRRVVRNARDMDENLKQLLSYCVTRGPRENDWLLVDSVRNIEMSYSTTQQANPEDDDAGNRGKGGGTAPTSSRTTTFMLRSCGGAAENDVDAFIDEALEYYKSLRKKAIDSSRYFFMPRMQNQSAPQPPPAPRTRNNPYGTQYKKYVLSEHKTFQSLYFPEKPQVLQMLDDFMLGGGKFKIPGFPNKLGLLLHGPPGTGKTSLIKSIAQYTKRHIVDVALSKIKTNQQLFDSMFDLVFDVSGEDEAVRMKFSDVVFVMEDIDATSKVVYKRKDNAKKQKKKTSKQEKLATGASIDKQTILAENLPHMPEKQIGKLDNPSSLPPAPPPIALQLVRTITIGSEAGDDNKDVVEKSTKTSGDAKKRCESEDSNDEDEKTCSRKHQLLSAVVQELESRDFHEADELNLSGLLNVLDGVVDSPGRIVVMTTNHPEKLDPALIRPGRINFAIELGYMKSGPLCELIEHLMQSSLTEEQCRRASVIAAQGQVTPAKVEQSCAEAESIDMLLSNLEELEEVSGVQKS